MSDLLLSDAASAEKPGRTGTVVGIEPWLPRLEWLGRLPGLGLVLQPFVRVWSGVRGWWTDPLPAERLAALRIGVALVLLLDVLFTYLPHGRDYFGADSLGSPALFKWVFQPGKEWNAIRTDPEQSGGYLERLRPIDEALNQCWRWSLLRDMEDPAVIDAALGVWAVATVCLLIGCLTRLSAVTVWVLSTSFAHLNSYIDNAGDLVRGIILFYLVLCPCGAVWSIDAAFKRRLGWLRDPVQVYPWVVRLLFLQMILIYWCNGLYKLAGPDWRSGNALYYVLGDLTLTRWSYAQVPIPYLITRLMSWSVLVWEVVFPLPALLPEIVSGHGRFFNASRERMAPFLSVARGVRTIALLFGVAFHLGIGLSMELGGFVPYMLCLYLPLLPWERLTSRGRRSG